MNRTEATTDYFGVDTEIFQFLLERSVNRNGEGVCVNDIIARLQVRMNRTVTLEEITETINKTRYKNHGTPAYRQSWGEGVLTHVYLVPGAHEESWKWGY